MSLKTNFLVSTLSQSINSYSIHYHNGATHIRNYKWCFLNFHLTKMCTKYPLIKIGCTSINIKLNAFNHLYVLCSCPKKCNYFFVIKPALIIKQYSSIKLISHRVYRIVPSTNKLEKINTVPVRISQIFYF